jgi:squalene-hopene/tetraprenyl-beta-curcumene cyclase
MHRTLLAALTCAAALVGGEAPLPTKQEVEQYIAEGQNWLLAQQQPNGAFVPGQKFVLGISQLAMQSLATEPLALKATDPRMEKALAFQQGFIQKDGGVYEEGLGLGNYTTSLALKAWALTKTGSPEAIKGAQNYLFGIQNTDVESPNQGGIGYGSGGKGNEDLSNTAHAVQALRMSGVPASDPHLQRAIQFLQNCQDLSSHNKLPNAQGNTGGAFYAPHESKAGGSWDKTEPKPGEAPPKMLPYGSMTYQLISTYLVLDIKPGDPRIDAALAWVKSNYRWDANPGMAAGKERQGLFYYFGAAAKTYDLIDAGAFTLKDGARADWRADLFAAIKREAETNGKQVDLGNGQKGRFWINPEKRWGEDMPHLTTSYVVEALKRIHASL